jgi:murein DD-endopeptidase MepM/ murein hydrolase activator NlpD
LSGGKNSLQRTEIEEKAVAKAIHTRTAVKLWSDEKAFVLPSSARRSSVYGLRRTYNGKLAQNYFHKGLDFAAFTGASILAPADGKVILIGKEKDGFAVHGNCVFIDHGQGLVSGYLHLSEHQVAVGDLVKAGQTVLGKVGDTGIASGPHLHFGLYLNGENINPDSWLKYPVP